MLNIIVDYSLYFLVRTSAQPLKNHLIIRKIDFDNQNVSIPYTGNETMLALRLTSFAQDKNLQDLLAPSLSRGEVETAINTLERQKSHFVYPEFIEGCTLIDDVRTCLRQGYGKAGLSEGASRVLENH